MEVHWAVSVVMERSTFFLFTMVTREEDLGLVSEVVAAVGGALARVVVGRGGALSVRPVIFDFGTSTILCAFFSDLILASFSASTFNFASFASFTASFSALSLASLASLASSAALTAFATFFAFASFLARAAFATSSSFWRATVAAVGWVSRLLLLAFLSALGLGAGTGPSGALVEVVALAAMDLGVAMAGSMSTSRAGLVSLGLEVDFTRDREE